MNDKKNFAIYKISGRGFVYVGVTTQPLNTRFSQHKRDAKSDKWSITSKLCQKKPPSDVQALHQRLKDNSSNYRIEKIKDIKGSYNTAHAEELKIKSRLSSVKLS